MFSCVNIDKSTYYIIGTITLWNLYRVMDNECNIIKEEVPKIYDEYKHIHYGLKYFMLGTIGCYTLRLSYV
jgi:hypothetical protein